MINPFFAVAKKTFFLGGAVLTWFFLLSSCGDSGETDNSILKVSVSELTFDAAGGTQSVSVTAEPSWKAEVPSDGREWLTASTSNNALRVTVKENLLTSARKSYVELKSGNKSVKILVNQHAFIFIESIRFNEEELSLEEGESKQVAVTIYPENASKRLLKWSVADTSIATVDSTGKVTAHTEGSTTLSATSQDGSKETASCKIKVFELHEYVDLGLPSRTLWASRNLGAKEPWNTGDYFAWGILRSYEGGQIFNSEHYKYYNVTTKSWTKYVTDTRNGTPDNLTELDPTDDAATYYWGPKWTMPTTKQFQELIDNCDWTRVNDTKAEKYGWLVESRKNNRNIFFPFTGQYTAIAGATSSDSNKDPENFGKNLYGRYWTKNLNLDMNDSADILYFESHMFSVSTKLRYYGIPIRPVRTYPY